MDIPKSCYECPCLKKDSWWRYCGIPRKDGTLIYLDNKYGELIYDKSRHPECQLREGEEK